MSLQKSAMKGVLVTLQDAASAAAGGTVIAIPSSFRHHKLFIKGSAGVASGAVQPEAASTYNYSGTWGQVGGGPISVVASSELVIDLEGVFSFLRCRISTLIGGGTVTVQYLGS